MTAKPIIPRERANRDIEDAINYYLREGGERAALGYIDALENAYRQIGRYPASGSLRYGQECGLADMLFWPLKTYPYLIFYLEREDHIDLWRVLHGERDIPAWMREK